MTGKTHIAIGVASSLVLIRPNNIRDIFITVAVSSFSSLLVDIDIKTSKVSKILKSVFLLVLLMFISSIAVNYIFKLGYIKETFEQIDNKSWFLIMLGVITFLFFTFIIVKGSHRGFTHSLLAVMLLGIIGYVWFLPIVNYSLIIGYSMHIIADILNKRGVQVFYPFPNRYCFHLCKSDGVTNKILFFTGMLICTVMVVLLLFGIVK